MIGQTSIPARVLGAFDVYEWCFIVALAVSGLVVLVATGKFVFDVVRDIRRDRAAEARRVTRELPGLGPFSSTDGGLWEGRVNGLMVFLVTQDQPPGEPEAARLRAVLDVLPQYTQAARSYLKTQDWTKDVAPRGTTGEHLNTLTPYSLELTGESTFVLELADPIDANVIYRVEFRGGEPVECGFDY